MLNISWHKEESRFLICKFSIYILSNVWSQSQAQLYRAGCFTSAVRLLHAQAPMEDDWKLCEYSLPEGTTISVLFEPDVDINIEVSTCHQMQKLTASNATSVMELKVQICGIMKCGISPEKLEIRLGDVTTGGSNTSALL